MGKHCFVIQNEYRIKVENFSTIKTTIDSKSQNESYSVARGRNLLPLAYNENIHLQVTYRISFNFN